MKWGCYDSYRGANGVKCGTMEATIHKPSVGAMLLALPMLLFGSLMFLFGYFDLREWQAERAAADCVRTGVDLDWTRGVWICAVAVGIAGP